MVTLPGFKVGITTTAGAIVEAGAFVATGVVVAIAKGATVVKLAGDGDGDNDSNPFLDFFFFLDFLPFFPFFFLDFVKGVGASVSLGADVELFVVMSSK